MHLHSLRFALLLAACFPCVSSARAEQGPVPAANLIKPRPLCAGRPVAQQAGPAAGLTGLVLVTYTVEADGKVSQVEDKSPQPSLALFGAARDWLLACPHEAARQGDKAIQVRITQPFKFRNGAVAE
jgi:hypothetical protein